MTPLLLALAVGAPAPKADPKPTENPLVGEWVVESYVNSGRPVAGGRKADRVTITRDRWAPRGELDAAAFLSLDPMKDPPHIDVWLPSQEENRARGIYKLEGDTLTVSCHMDGERPAAFESAPKSGVLLMTLKRVPK